MNETIKIRISEDTIIETSLKREINLDELDMLLFKFKTISKAFGNLNTTNNELNNSTKPLKKNRMRLRLSDEQKIQLCEEYRKTSAKEEWENVAKKWNIPYQNLSKVVHYYSKILNLEPLSDRRGRRRNAKN